MRSWSRGAPSARSCSRASAAEGRGGRAFGKCRSETAILGGNSTFRQVLPTMSFDTPFALCGPFRQPRQMLAEQEAGQRALGDVQPGPFAPGLPVDQGAHDGARGEQGDNLVGIVERMAADLRHAIGGSYQARQAARPLQGGPEGYRGGVGPGAALARYRRQDDAGIGRPERGVAEAQRLHGAGAEILHDDVAGRHHVQHDGAALLGFEVDANALLLPVGEAEMRAAVPPVGLLAAAQPFAERVEIGWTLDLDDLGAQIGEQGRGPRPGRDDAEIQNAQP